MSELFPASTRATGLGLSYNISVTALDGGLRIQSLGIDRDPPEPGRPLCLTGSKGAKPPKVTFYSGPDYASIMAAIQPGEQE
jgi:hypothetical protein